MEAMTLEQVRDRIDRLAGENKVYAYIHLAELTEWVIAIDAHLAHPAQAVDVEKRVREIEYAISCGELNAPAVFTQMRQLIPRALSGEKAGPVGDGWVFRWHTEGDDSLLLISHPEHGGVGVHKEPTSPRMIPEEMLYLLARDLLPASPTPGKEGEG